MGHGFLIVEDLRPYSHTPQSVGLLWTSDQLVAQTSTWQHNTHNRQTSVPLEGFEPTIPTSERPLGSALFVFRFYRRLIMLFLSDSDRRDVTPIATSYKAIVLYFNAVTVSDGLVLGVEMGLP